MNLYDLPVTLHTLKRKGLFMKKRESYYLSQSLEYQLYGINRTKAFVGFLEATSCFFSDRLLDNP